MLRDEQAALRTVAAHDGRALRRAVHALRALEASPDFQAELLAEQTMLYHSQDIVTGHSLRMCWGRSRVLSCAPPRLSGRFRRGPADRGDHYDW